MLKNVLRSAAVQGILASLLAGYLRLVWHTSKIVYEPPDLYDRLEPHLPIIVCMWHGEHFMMPFLRRPHDKVKVMISRHRDGNINAMAAAKLGLGLIRGSGSHGTQNPEKRGAVALIEMLRALREGFIVTMTGDIPKVAKVASGGIVLLGKKAQRKIVPTIVVSSRRITFKKSWDQSKLALPFGRVVIAAGDPIDVAPDADEAAMEAVRKQVEAGLNRVMERAYQVADGRRAA